MGGLFLFFPRASVDDMARQKRHVGALQAQETVAEQYSQTGTQVDCGRNELAALQDHENRSRMFRYIGIAANRPTVTNKTKKTQAGALGHSWGKPPGLSARRETQEQLSNTQAVEKKGEKTAARDRRENWSRARSVAANHTGLMPEGARTHRNKRQRLGRAATASCSTTHPPLTFSGGNRKMNSPLKKKVTKKTCGKKKENFAQRSKSEKKNNRQAENLTCLVEFRD
jgi:hypothetical protein